MKRSAGLVPFVLERRGALRVLRVVLVHPGGPYWAKKDAGAWSICKGEFGEGEDARTVAAREFEEELGQQLPRGDWLELGEVTQAGGKRVVAWGLEAEVDVEGVASNRFELEWPPRSGTYRSFPEVDRAAWFDLAEARWRILRSQLPLLDALLDALASHGVSELSSGDAGTVA